ncbi:MAG: hypothetical protein Q6356_001900 [Candidatus Wukongarchaeota archaeon]|nr:hypothetical protein [Candidatus Wukongarchaeota archaeon]
MAVVVIFIKRVIVEIAEMMMNDIPMMILNFLRHPMILKSYTLRIK